ncbi:major vault protein, putative [Trypanosoma cruzi marinkellei]|uniref:Major vault protein, putative n=1 Tax=Trypanosoma cruzi marinkellei TaxID=85056 RepID=K2N0Y0_TRYCR|nr:major vault protein, putative [Trypanosoma cruzi marinkellei]
MTTLVVSTQHPKRLWISNFKGKEEKCHLTGENTPVNVVPKKQILRFTWIPTKFQQRQQVVVLTMYVATHGNRILQVQNIRFLHKQHASGFNQPKCVGLLQDTTCLEVLLENCGVGHTYIPINTTITTRIACQLTWKQSILFKRKQRRWFNRGQPSFRIHAAHHLASKSTPWKHREREREEEKLFSGITKTKEKNNITNLESKIRKCPGNNAQAAPYH